MFSRLPVVFLLFVMLSAQVHAHTVNMNFAYHIGDDKNNTIHVNGENFNGTEYLMENYDVLEKPYISSEKDGVVSGLVFSGSRFVNAALFTSFNDEDYLLQITQDDEKNRFIIPFTQGTWRNIEDSSAVTYGSFTYKTPASFTNFLVFENNEIEIVGNVAISGEKKLFVRNHGISDRKSAIEIGVIE